jgi:hypothetical protein
MKLLAALLMTVAISAHAQSDDTTPIQTHATLVPCPNGPGVAVEAIEADGQETWAGCWGADPVVRHPDDHEDHHVRTHHNPEEQK